VSFTYAYRKRKEDAATEKEAAQGQPSMEALRSGAAIPSPEQMGHRVDLPDAMRSKMENAFGADLSAVKLYESQAVADVGSQAITQGADIAFAPGLLDFSSFGGQALLGHEISHVVSQARGEVTGGGFLHDVSLEARADREGAMAAAGQTVTMPSASLSPVSAADAAGPMQAKVKPEKHERHAQEFRGREIDAYDRYVMATDPEKKAALEQEYRLNREKKAGRMRKAGKTDEEIERDHLRTTDVLQQMSRAHERNVVAPWLRENDEALQLTPENPRTDFDTDESRAARERLVEREKASEADRYGNYLGDLKKILGSMSDDELKAQPRVQNAMVSAYAHARRSQAAAGRGGLSPKGTEGAFIPGGEDDLMVSMYTRLMGGKSAIAGTLAQDSQDAALGDLTALADASGVTGLMRQQQEQTTRHELRNYMDADVEKQVNTMRDFWSRVAVPAAAGTPQAAANAAEMTATLGRITNAQANARLNGQYIPRTNEKLNAVPGGDFLLHLTPAIDRVERMGEMPEAPPPQPEPEPVPAPAPAPAKVSKRHPVAWLKHKLGRDKQEPGMDEEKLAAEAEARKRFKQQKRKKK